MDRFSSTLFIRFNSWGRTIVQKQKGTIHERVFAKHNPTRPKKIHYQLFLRNESVI